MQELKELRSWLRTLLLSVLSLIPFWVTILFYYSPNILELGWSEKVVILSVPSFLWYVCSYFIIRFNDPVYSFLLRHRYPKKDRWFIASGLSFAVLIILSQVVYYWKLSLEKFCLVSFGYFVLSVGVGIIYSAFLLPILKKQRMKRLLSERKKRNITGRINAQI